MLAAVRRAAGAAIAARTAAPEPWQLLGLDSAPPASHVVPELRATSSLGDLVRRSLADGLQRLVRSEPHARLGDDVEGVHQLRVATRRLRSDLRTMRRHLDVAAVDALRGELGWLADLLGAVRDPDVLGMRLVALLADLPDAEPGGARLLAHLTEQHDQARAALLAALDGPRVVALRTALHRAIEQPPGSPEQLAVPVHDAVPALVGRVWKPVARAVDALGDDPPDTALHELRLLVKRLRYAVELLVPIEGKPARRTAKAAAALSDELGVHQDAAVAAAWLHAAAVDLGDAEAAFVAGRIAGHEDAAAAAVRQRWPAQWETLASARSRGWFAGRRHPGRS